MSPPCLLVFGLGYTAARLARRLRGNGWAVVATRRTAGPDALAFDDDAAVLAALGQATHILSSVPPDGVTGTDPVLARYGQPIGEARIDWLGYLSSTGVYGDAQGAWVDETAPIGRGRRNARTAADLAWQALHPQVRIFRLPGIYGPGRSALDRVAAGDATRINAPGHAFSRIHVDDIVAAVVASFDHGAPGVYNIADDLPAEGRAVAEYACDLLGLPWPPLEPLATAALSPMARGFYAESRRVAATKMKRDLGVQPCYANYRVGLRACLKEIR